MRSTAIRIGAIQWCAAAIVMPMTLTLISEAFPADKRGTAIGIWGGVQGFAIAAGPVIGGTIVAGLNWHWIFWLNIPVGLVVAPLEFSRRREWTMRIGDCVERAAQINADGPGGDTRPGRTGVASRPRRRDLRARRQCHARLLDPRWETPSTPDRPSSQSINLTLASYKLLA